MSLLNHNFTLNGDRNGRQRGGRERESWWWWWDENYKKNIVVVLFGGRWVERLYGSGGGRR